MSDLIASADIDLSAKAPNLNLVTHWFGQAMPEQWGPIKAKAKLTGRDSQYALENINLDMDGKSKVSATGSIDSLIGFNNMILGYVTLAPLHEQLFGRDLLGEESVKDYIRFLQQTVM